MMETLNFSMYPPETLTLKEFFECDYDQPEMGPFYCQSNGSLQPPGPETSTDYFENPFGTPPQTACYTVPVGGNPSPGYNSTTASYTPKEEDALTQLYRPHKSPVSSSLPTPPQSPPSTENDLDNIIATFPEILEFPPTFLFPAVEDVLFDLETIPYNTGLGIPSIFEEESHLPKSQHQLDRRENSGQIPKALKKDSMWGGGPFMTTDDHRLKTRTVSESSEEYRHHSVYSDEEYEEHLPDSPCVSDEDVEHLDAKELSSNLNNITSSAASSSDQIQASSSFINVISSDHNYCGKCPSENGSKNVDTASPPNSPSTLVKRQLQLAIQESMNNKQKRGRIGRPPKVLKSSPVSSPGIPFSIDLSDVSSSVLKSHTQGKPASYTRRMREQHTEILKTNKSKRKRTLSKDPECEIEKRSNHNIMERNRRVNIKNLFDMLRQNVPEIHDNERASKVLILNKSREFIEQNERTFLRLEYEYTTEKERNLILKRRLQSLQAHH